MAAAAAAPLFLSEAGARGFELLFRSSVYSETALGSRVLSPGDATAELLHVLLGIPTLHVRIAWHSTADDLIDDDSNDSDRDGRAEFGANSRQNEGFPRFVLASAAPGMPIARSRIKDGMVVMGSDSQPSPPEGHDDEDPNAASVRLEGLSDSAFAGIVQPILNHGSLVLYLEQFVARASRARRESQTVEAMGLAVAQFLQWRRAEVLRAFGLDPELGRAVNYSEDVQIAGLAEAVSLQRLQHAAGWRDMTPFKISTSMHALFQQTQQVCHDCRAALQLLTNRQQWPPLGCAVLSALYTNVLLLRAMQLPGATANPRLELERAASRPFLHFLSEWIFRGCVADPLQEFGLATSETGSAAQSEVYWTHSVTLGHLGQAQSGQVWLPSFAAEIGAQILRSGKSIRLLSRLTRGRHSLLADGALRQLSLTPDSRHGKTAATAATSARPLEDADSSNSFLDTVIEPALLSKPISTDIDWLAIARGGRTDALEDSSSATPPQGSDAPLLLPYLPVVTAAMEWGERVNIALIHEMFAQHSLDRVAAQLVDLVLCRKVDFSEALLNRLFEIATTRPPDVLRPAILAQCLDDAFGTAPSRALSEQRVRQSCVLSVQAPRLLSDMHSYETGDASPLVALLRIELVLSAGWPCNLVFTNSVMMALSRCRLLLIQLNYARWCMSRCADFFRSVEHSFTRDNKSAASKQQARLSVRHDVRMLHYELQHFFRSLVINHKNEPPSPAAIQDLHQEFRKYLQHLISASGFDVTPLENLLLCLDLGDFYRRNWQA
ncbi:hypothetical protein CAOG_007819 [Capsaspora owczarzaki ATCC 30864]|uniref:Spindle pole body component n=1 Tax=Capsaspora owczarzaki (strain ATCC 30864) TaxID=595528 RepID=A0A0D2X5F4_CAPO3|nr:hypothetical protein CAOG_007819 [Capsaspora owczarzaki ATCC 30864]